MGVKKRVEPAAILRSRFQVIERRLNRDVAYETGQTPGKVGGILMSQYFSSDGGGAAQLQERNSMKICIQFIEGTEHAEQLRGGLLADARHTGDVVAGFPGQRQAGGDELGA